MSRNCRLVPLLIVVSFTNGRALAQGEVIGDGVKLPAHPRLLLLKGEEGAVKRGMASHKVWGEIHDQIIMRCDGLLDAAPANRVMIGRRLLSTARKVLHRVFYLSYAYRMTGDEKYARRAEREMLAACAFEDWNPGHYLDVAELTMAVAIGYDWLHDRLSDECKRAAREAIVKKGIEPSFVAPYTRHFEVTHNWNQVLNAGLTYGALAVFEDEPELARKVINRSIKSIAHPMSVYSPDGAYPEGYSYWGYGTSFNVMYLGAMEKAFGNLPTLKSDDFLKTAYYMRNMVGPTGKAFNYSDASPAGGLQPAMFWLAGRLKDPSLLWIERQHLRGRNEGDLDGGRLLPALMIWGPTIDLDAIERPSDRLWVGRGPNPVALMRTSWGDPDAVFVGFKAGSPSVNHGHMDIGSFVMEADGVRWAMDFEKQSYESLESKGIKVFKKEQDGQRWRIFRNTNYAHNTLTVDGQLQRAAGYAPIVKSSDTPSFLSAVADLRDVYKGSLARASRGVAIVNRDHVLVRDEFQTLGQEATIRWNLLTPARVKILDDGRAELTQKGKKLTVRVVEPRGTVLKTWSTDPPRGYDAKNPGTMFVGFEAKVPAASKHGISVMLIPEGATPKAGSKVDPLDEWPLRTKATAP